MNAHAEPVHGVAVVGKRVEHGGQTARNGPSLGQVCSERLGLFGGGEFFVEEEVNHIFRGEVSQFGDGVAAVVNPFRGGHKRGAAGANRNATKTGVQMSAGDGEQRFVLAHLLPSKKSDTQGWYKGGS